MDDPTYTPLTPLLLHPGLPSGIRLLLKRDDLLHPVIQGNKWRKLEPALKQVQQEGRSGILTFGGPFSNHLHAVAAAGQVFGIKTTGIVRGTAADFNNPTLGYARSCGMALFAVPKKDFDEKGPFTQDVIREFPDYLYLPEGGATPAAAANCQQLANEIYQQLTELGISAAQNPIFLAIPAGTGCTAAGLAAGWSLPGTVLIFPAATYGVDMEALQSFWPANRAPIPEIRFIPHYTQGGFAKLPPDLYAFVRQFETDTGILLDPVYTSKMMFGIFDLLDSSYFPEKSVVVVVHTGGLQGWNGVTRE